MLGRCDVAIIPKHFTLPRKTLDRWTHLNLPVNVSHAVEENAQTNFSEQGPSKVRRFSAHSL